MAGGGESKRIAAQVPRIVRKSPPPASGLPRRLLSTVLHLLLWAHALPLVVIFILFFLPLLCPGCVLKGTVESLLAEELERPVHIEDLDLLWWTWIRANEIEVAARKGESGPLIVVPRGNMRVRLWPLFRGELDMQRLSFFAPKIRLQFDEAGRINVRDLFVSDPGKSTASSTEPRAMLRALRLVDADVIITDLGSGRRYEIPTLNLEARRLLSARQIYDVSLEFSQALGKASRMGVRVQGTYDMLLTERPDRSERLRLIVRNGRVAAEIDQGDSLDLQNLNVAWNQYQGPDRAVRSDLWLQGELARSRFHFSAKTEPSPDSNDRHTFVLSASDIDCFPLVRFVRRLADLMSPSSAPDGVPNYLKSLHAEGSLKLKSLAYGPTVVRDVLAGVRLKGGRIRVDHLAAGFSGGRLQATFEAELAGGVPQWSLHGKLEAVRGDKGLQTICDLMNPRVFVVDRGRGSLSLNVAARGISGDQMTRTVQGRLEAQFGPLTLLRDRPPGSIARLFPALDTREIRLKEMALQSKVAEGRGTASARLVGIPPIPVGYASAEGNLPGSKYRVEWGIDPWASMHLGRRKESRFRGVQGFAIMTLEGTPWRYEWHTDAPHRFTRFMKELLLDNPVVLINPNMSAQEKGRYIAAQFKGLAGTFLKPIEVLGEGGLRAIYALVNAPISLIEAFVGQSPKKDEAKDSPNTQRP